MESIQNIKKRLRTVKNVSQITKAMELVAATKMRRSQEIAIASRPYALAALQLLSELQRTEAWLPELLRKRETKRVLFVLVASDKGLAGAFNGLIIRKLEKHLADNPASAKEEYLFAAVGERAFKYLERKKFTIIKTFARVGDFTSPEETKPIAEFLAEGYLEKKWDKVIVFSFNFRSALKQEPVMQEVLPIEASSVRRAIMDILPEAGKFSGSYGLKEDDFSFTKEPQEYLVEPDRKKVLEALIRHLFFMRIYHLILEANVSEHAARRLAMKTASDNGEELYFDLTLLYNKSRQTAITREIAEIAAASSSLS